MCFIQFVQLASNLIAPTHQREASSANRTPFSTAEPHCFKLLEVVSGLQTGTFSQSRDFYPRCFVPSAGFINVQYEHFLLAQGCLSVGDKGVDSTIIWFLPQIVLWCVNHLEKSAPCTIFVFYKTVFHCTEGLWAFGVATD